jgi:hypothetical protein
LFRFANFSRDVSTLATKISDPVLAVAWGKRLKMLQVLIKPDNPEDDPKWEDLVFVEICDFLLDDEVKCTYPGFLFRDFFFFWLLPSSALLILSWITSVYNFF